MAVKIVTDSVADLPPDVAEELGISVVPLRVRFGEETYRDGVDLTIDEFFDRLTTSRTMPVTSVPPPGDFSSVYDKLAEETDEILVVALTSRLSGTCEVALQSVGLMQKKCRVEVIDSKTATMAQGMVAIAAAELAQTGAKLDDIIEATHRNISRVEMRATFDTMEFLQRGGRIGKAQSLLGSILNINPIIGIQEGEVVPISRERSRARAIDHLYNFAAGYSSIEKMAVEYGNSVEEAEALVKRLGSVFPEERIYLSNASPVMGTHAGPGLLVVSVLGDK